MNPRDVMIEEKIRELSYYLWERDHRPEGKELEYWLLAEKMVEAHTVITSEVDEIPKGGLRKE